MGAPLTVGYGEGENYLGSDALALAPLTQRIAYLDEGDWAVVAPRRLEIFDHDNQPVDARDRRVRRVLGADREGQLPPLHAEGDLRAADRRRADAAELRPPVRGRGRAAAMPMSTSAAIDRVTIVACGTSYYAGHGRQILVRAVRPRSGRHRCRERVPLPRAGARARRAGAVHLAKSGETADTLAALRHCKARGAEDRGGRQRADQLDGARGRPAAADPCRARDRRRLDQGVHLPAGGARRARRATSRAPRAG